MTDPSAPMPIPKPISIPCWLGHLQESGCMELDEASGCEDDEVGWRDTEDSIALDVVGNEEVEIGAVVTAATVADAVVPSKTTREEGAGATKVSFPGSVQSTISSVGLKQQAQS